MIKNKCVLVCPSCTDFLYDSNFPIGGMNIQMYMWAQTFIDHGWDVYSLTHLQQHKNVKKDGVNHIFFKRRNHFEAFFIYFYYLYVLMKYHPSLVIVRGRGLSIHPLSIYSKLMGIKLVFMVAADTNMDKGHEAKANFATKMFRRAIKQVDYIIAQNTVQQEQIAKYYHKDSIIIPNIWRNVFVNDSTDRTDEVVWVGNVKKVKRPSWFLDLAERFPQYRFVMIGGSPRDGKMYNESCQRARALSNVEFAGRMEFKEADARIQKAKVLVCTSISEGFPNTFLQAWSNNVPVVSTVNPNDIITENQMGFVGDSVDALSDGLTALMQNNALYAQYANNVANYFKTAHNPDVLFTKLMDYIK